MNISGTNMSVRQRLSLLYLYLCTISVAQAVFYGQDQSTLWQDIVASAITSLLGTFPSWIVMQLFTRSRPNKRIWTKSKSSTFYGSSLATPENRKKFKDAQTERRSLYKRRYPLPSYCRKVAWILVIVSSAMFCTSAV